MNDQSDIPHDTSEKRTRPVRRGVGVTEAERSLQKLCDRTFLSLWSYPSVYRDQGKQGKTSSGKEIADLLVVFGNDLIIFSDKDCVYPDTGDPKLDWSRWFKKAIWKSAQQAWGAERWIRQQPGRLFLDPMCSEPFPLDLPPPERMRFHHIVVAHNAAERCKAHFGGGSGSLMLTNDIRGDEHFDETHEVAKPFVVGDLDPRKGFVHVLDDATLDLVLTTRDTVADLTAYLRAKEALFRSETKVMAAGEEELLAQYLSDVHEKTGEHDFCIPRSVSAVFFDEGSWLQFAYGDERRSQVEADRISYGWDSLIERFNRHILSGTYYIATDPSARAREQVVRFMAAEPRFRRRGLAKAFIGLVQSIPPGTRDKRAVRVVPSACPDDPFYVFLVLPPLTYAQDQQAYREARMSLLYAYCMATKHEHPHAQHIVGLACSSLDAGSHSEDAIYLDAREWTQEMEAEAVQLRREANLLNEVSLHRFSDMEYPAGRSWSPRRKNPRNKPCSCGSGRKYKHCHGRS